MSTAIAPLASRVAAPAAAAGLSWARIVQLGLVQTAIGAVVVLMTSTLNRVLVVELGLPASVPGVLVALHFAVQLARARVGHASDAGGRRTRWIVGGMVLLALSATAAAASVALVAERRTLGLLATAAAFVGIGIGVSACGTALLALVAERVAPARRGRAVAILWIMMIMGLAGTAGGAGAALDPFTLDRLVLVCGAVSAIAVALTIVGVLGVERGAPAMAASSPATREPGAFARALREVWADAQTRRFALFVFVSMVAYSAQDLVLEPYAGLVFGMTPGQSTRIGGLQHGGALVGMIAAAMLSAHPGMLRLLAVGGCLASGAALLGVAHAGAIDSVVLLRGAVAALGVANGAFAVGALGSMVALTGDDRSGRSGLRLGVFGAAQAVAYAAGGLLGAAVSDVARLGFRSAAAGYGTVFVIEAACFAAAAVLAVRAAPRAAAGVLRADGDRMLAVLR